MQLCQVPGDAVPRISEPAACRSSRRDIWLGYDGDGWHVRGRHGGPDDLEVRHVFDREYEARAMVRRLKAAPPRPWEGSTRPLRKPCSPRPRPGGPAPP